MRIGIAAIVLSAGVCLAGDTGFDWVTIGDVGNPAYTDGPDDTEITLGRGSVDYAYRISRFEVTTSQWVEFTNAASNLGRTFVTQLVPTRWGAVPDIQGGEIVGYKLKDEPNAGMRPVDNLDWRDVAYYVNWLHNGKGDALDDFTTGVYDANNWVIDPVDNSVTGVERNPDAMYWIPTLDEWMKAAHYDPNKHGEGQGGWWLYSNMSDTQGPTPGRPEDGGETLSGLGNIDELWDYPLGSFPDVTSAYGLLDLSGGGSEFLEDIFRQSPFSSQQTWLGGSGIGGSELFDRIDSFEFGPPLFGRGTLRIASRVPACPADLTGDGVLDAADLDAFAAAFLALSPDADLTGDGVLNLDDIDAFVAGYHAGCEEGAG